MRVPGSGSRLRIPGCIALIEHFNSCFYRICLGLGLIAKKKTCLQNMFASREYTSYKGLGLIENVRV